MIWVLVLLVALIAIAGGLAVSKFLLALLLFALVLAFMGMFSGRGAA